MLTCILVLMGVQTSYDREWRGVATYDGHATDEPRRGPGPTPLPAGPAPLGHRALHTTQSDCWGADNRPRGFAFSNYFFFFFFLKIIIIIIILFFLFFFFGNFITVLKYCLAYRISSRSVRTRQRGRLDSVRRKLYSVCAQTGICRCVFDASCLFALTLNLSSPSLSTMSL